MKMGNYFFMSQAILILVGLGSVLGVGLIWRKRSKRIWHSIMAGFLCLICLCSVVGLVSTIYFKRLFGIDKEGKAAPNLVYQSLPDEISKSLIDHKGKVVILNLWATWCGPCLREMPELNRIQNDFKDNKVVVLAISDETTEELAPYLEKNKFTINFGKTDDSNYFREDSVRPTTFIIDREGVIREVYIGEMNYEKLSQAIKHYIE